MESRSRGLWETIHDAEARAAADFFTPTGRALGPSGGDAGGESGTRATSPLRPPARVPPPVVAPEIAVRIINAFATGGATLAALANQWHLDPGEVAQIIGRRLR